MKNKRHLKIDISFQTLLMHPFSVYQLLNIQLWSLTG